MNFPGQCWATVRSRDSQNHRISQKPCLFEAGRRDDHIPILQNDVILAVVDEGEVKHLSQQEINADLLRRAGLDVPSLVVPFLVKPSESEFLTWEDPAATPGTRTPWQCNRMTKSLCCSVFEWNPPRGIYASVGHAMLQETL